MAQYYFLHGELWVIAAKNSTKTRHRNLQRAAAYIYHTSCVKEDEFNE